MMNGSNFYLKLEANEKCMYVMENHWETDLINFEAVKKCH